MTAVEKIWTALLGVVVVNIVFFSSQTPQVINAVFGTQGVGGLVGTLEKQNG